MLKSLIAGVAALGLVVSATPNRAAADGNDVLRGVIAGAIILGTIAALDDHYDRKRSRSHSHGHSHGHKHLSVKPIYGHYGNRHGARIYADRNYRYRHDDYRYRHRDDDYKRHDGHRHSGDHRRSDDRARGSDYHSHGDYRHRNHDGYKRGHDHKHGGQKDAGDRGKKGDKKQVQRLRQRNERLVHQNAELRRQLERRERYVQSLNSYGQ